MRAFGGVMNLHVHTKASRDIRRTCHGERTLVNSPARSPAAVCLLRPAGDSFSALKKDSRCPAKAHQQQVNVTLTQLEDASSFACSSPKHIAIREAEPRTLRLELPSICT